MITKQQALEFIYDLSQKTEVKIDIPRGVISAYEDFKYVGVYHYKFQKEETSLEELVTGFIKTYLDIELLNDIKIPMDVDMLKVGQTYKVIFDEACITDELTHISNNICYFKEHYPLQIQDIKEIYKVHND